MNRKEFIDLLIVCGRCPQYGKCLTFEKLTDFINRELTNNYKKPDCILHWNDLP